MNILKTAAIATAFAASLLPLSAMAVNQPLICMGQRIDVGASFAELVQSCGKPLSTSQTGEGLVLNYRIRGSGNTNVTVNGRGIVTKIKKKNSQCKYINTCIGYHYML